VRVAASGARIETIRGLPAKKLAIGWFSKYSIRLQLSFLCLPAGHLSILGAAFLKFSPKIFTVSSCSSLKLGVVQNSYLEL
jgi:hypothetical protein